MARVAMIAAAVLTLAVLMVAPGADAAGTPDVAPRSAGVWSPTPARAPGDKPVVYRSCHASVVDTAPKACVLGAPSSHRTVVLIGDSHAANWVPGVAAAAVRRSWRFLSVTKTTCPAEPVAVTLSADLAHPRAYLACRRWRANVLAALPRWHPQVVLVAGSHSTRMIAADGRVYTNATASRRARDAAWRAATQALLRALHRAVPTAVVLVVQDTPYARDDVLACVTRWGRAAGTRCSLPVRRALRAGERAAERAAIAVDPRARLVDPESALCGAGVCLPAAHGVLRYRDSGHLTATFAATLAPMWADVLDRSLLPLPAGPVLWPPLRPQVAALPSGP